MFSIHTISYRVRQGNTHDYAWEVRQSRVLLATTYETVAISSYTKLVP